MKKILPLLALIALPALAHVDSATVPPRVNGGDVLTAAQWNERVNGVYTFVNTYVAGMFNTMTTKGDLLSFTGSTFVRVPASTNGKVLYRDDSESSGLAFKTTAAENPTTTKGDLIYQAGSGLARLAVGSNDQILMASSELPVWASLSTAYPKGSILALTPTGRGATDIPSGWRVCDGTNSTPNLIGRILIGTRPPGSGSTASAGGYGAQAVDANGTGTATHSHVVSIPSGNTSLTTLNNASIGYEENPTTGAGVATVRNHDHPFNNHTITLDSKSTEPADFALIYIIKE